MPYVLNKLTPNLVVSDLQRSLEFYRDVLGFTVAMAVPDQPPHVFAGLQSGSVEVFLNALEPAVAEYPAFKGRPIGGTLTLFIEVVGIRQVYESLKPRVKVTMPLEKKWYGVTEFAFEDPDGYIITFAEQEP
jgi:catechol 2,3-dioxygenase-like lactoylglutathione lyase family enzyme